MSDEKIKVKDLAIELDIPNKELVSTLKELEITAKTASSMLTANEAEQARTKIRGVVSPKQNPGVIVRRRSKVAPEAAEETREKTPAGSTPVSPAPEVTTRTKAAAPKQDVTPKKNIASKPETNARIIQRPNAVQTPVTPEAVQEPVQTEAVKPESTQEARVVRPTGGAILSAEPELDATGHAVSSEPTPSKPEGEKTVVSSRQNDEAAAPQVRIISRPDPNTVRKQAEPRTATAYPARPGARSDGRQDTRPGARPDARPGARPGARPDTRPARPAPAPDLPFSGAAPADAEGKGGGKRQKGRRTVTFAGDRNDRKDRSASGEATNWTRGRRNKNKNKVQPQTATQPLKAAKRKLRVEEFIRISDMAHQMGLKANEIIKVLFALGTMATINQSLDIDTATLVAAEFGYEVEKVGFSEAEYIEAQSEADSPESLKSRPPVITIMGHVDHGKTSLLDAIRAATVASGEAGGITQHIGAYHVQTVKGEIVFLDTPGHEAFTAMRARGAQVTDIVVLVVAADDGVMEQTREAVNHAKAAGVPIMVAVNKMDKPEADPERVKRELADLGLVPEEWGGDTVYSYVSAKTRQGLDGLLEILALQAEILDLKANPDKAARGHIIEAKLDKGRGSLGTVLIQEGTLNIGDSFVCGIYFGRVRAIFNDQGKQIKKAGPSIPVEVQGFDGVPEAGEGFTVIADEKQAKRIADARTLKRREKDLAKESKVTLETFLARKVTDVESIPLNLIVKADVQGSLEAVQDALRKLSTEKVRIQLIHGGAGSISESDIILASASSAIVLGFNVRPTAKVKEIAEQENVEIRFYDVIYKVVEEIESAMEGLLAPVEREVYLGQAEVRDTFSVPKAGTIAGSHVADGKLLRNAQVRLLRDGVVIYTGKISSLRRFKDDVREVLKGYECGIGLENYNDIKNGDIIEAFEIVEEAAKL